MSSSAVILLCAIVGAFGIVMGGVAFCLRMLWHIRGSWDATNARLSSLVDRVTDLVARKDQDHARIERRSDELATRLERHLEWHDKH